MLRDIIAGLGLVLLVGSLLAGWALAGETVYTNAKGQRVWRKDDSGRVLNAKGQLRARENEQGRIYDDKGRYRGKEARDTAPAKNNTATVKN